MEDLRRFAAALIQGVSVSTTRASAWANHLLWYDAAGAPKFGIASLTQWLAQVESGAIDPRSEGSILHERNGAAILDGNRGVPHLILERAGALATEKARETGVGVIRVQGIENPGAGAAVAADMAIRPVAALLLGVGPTWSVALPTEEGLPALFDPTFGGETGSLNATMLGPLAAVLAPGDGWVVAALSVTALESLEAFQSRVTGAIAGLETSGSRLLPALWESRRREARANGVSLGSDAWASLQEWAAKLRVELPEGTPANGPPEGR